MHASHTASARRGVDQRVSSWQRLMRSGMHRIRHMSSRDLLMAASPEALCLWRCDSGRQCKHTAHRSDGRSTTTPPQQPTTAAITTTNTSLTKSTRLDVSAHNAASAEIRLQTPHCLRHIVRTAKTQSSRCGSWRERRPHHTESCAGGCTDCTEWPQPHWGAAGMAAACNTYIPVISWEA